MVGQFRHIDPVLDSSCIFRLHSWVWYR